MHEQTAVAIYGSRAEAERVRTQLHEIGIPEADIRLSAEDSQASASGLETAVPPDNSIAPRAHEGGFLDWLFGSEVPETDRNWYGSNLREGRTALAIYLRAGADRARIEDVLEASDPIDIGQEEALSGAQAGASGTTVGASPDVVTPPAAATGDEGVPPAETGSQGDAPGRRGSEGEQVIPVVKEELEVGKRPVERRHRIRTYVVTRPVEQDVMLRDERVVVERRPVSGEQIGGNEGLQEREFEVVERHEEPVVAKRARTTEEVVVHKEAAERTETVRDAVRETKVDIDKAAAGSKPGTESDRDTERSGGETMADAARELEGDVKGTASPDRKP
jgi:stress response protein YsnF